MDPTTASDKEKIITKVRKRFSKHCQDLKVGNKQSDFPSDQKCVRYRDINMQQECSQVKFLYLIYLTKF